MGACVCHLISWNTLSETTLSYAACTQVSARVASHRVGPGAQVCSCDHPPGEAEVQVRILSPLLLPEVTWGGTVSTHLSHAQMPCPV